MMSVNDTLLDNGRPLQPGKQVVRRILGVIGSTDIPDASEPTRLLQDTGPYSIIGP